jgi:hypothetical protein
MGKSELVLVAVVALAAISLFNLYGSMSPKKESLFNAWMEAHGKNYPETEK